MLSERYHIDRRAVLLDGLFLGIVVALSIVPYVAGLGLYSDDWSFLSRMHLAEDRSFFGLTSAMPEVVSTRPVQAMVLALLYSAFGLEPLGYHVFNGCVLVAATLLFYVALRELNLPRTLVLTIPLVFALLPHYSTDRFWIAAFQANVSVCLYFLSLYAHLKAVRVGGAALWIWGLVGTVALLGSVLAYEVVAPLFVLNALIVIYRPWRMRRAGMPARSSWHAVLLISALNVLALVPAAIYKFASTERAGVLGGVGTYIWNVKRMVIGSLSTSYGSYFLALPVKVRTVLAEYADAEALVLAAILGIIVFIYLFVAMRNERLGGRKLWAAVIGVGFVFFGMGYAIGLVTFDIGFSTTGMNNRTAIAAAIGVAATIVGFFGLTTSLLHGERARRAAFSLTITLVCVSGFLVIDSIADFWVRASTRQQEVIQRLKGEEIAEGSVVLLDGICPYVGPGVVFETNWDVSGILQLEIGETLYGDVIQSNTQISDQGIRTQLYDDVIHDYAYGDHLLVLDVDGDALHSLDTPERARDYFQMQTTGRVATDCPKGDAGSGTPIF